MSLPIEQCTIQLLCSATVWRVNTAFWIGQAGYLALALALALNLCATLREIVAVEMQSRQVALYFSHLIGA